MEKRNCPDCGAELELYIDLSEGPPDEVSIECDCGTSLVWKVEWEYTVWVGDFLPINQLTRLEKKEEAK